MAVDAKRIAKNTILMYFRMILVMGVTIFTSRIVLDKLGVDDYGLYNAVAGMVGMLAFLNNTLSKGTFRFITFELGNQDEQRLKTTFSTAFYTHIILMVLLLVFLETVGLWFIEDKLVVPSGRMFAAHCVYQISLLTMCLSIIQVPFTSCIIAHEDMSIYAYLGIFEAIAKLSVAYMLSISSTDKMILYASLMLGVQFIIFFTYVIFCRKRYMESSYYRVFDKTIFKTMLGFSGWNIIANLTESLKMQGSNVLINLFFKPSLIAAQAVSNQVNNVLTTFIYQFTTVINPQIIKLYASGNYKESQKFTLQTTVMVFVLVLIICLPLMYIIEPILNIWLVKVPERTAQFMRFALASQIIGVFNATLYTPMVASGKLKTNSLWGLYLGVGQYVVVYVLYKLGMDVIWLPCFALITCTVFSMFVKPYILHKEVGYDIKEMLWCYVSCFKILIPTVALTYALYYFVHPETLFQYAIILVGSVVIVGCCAIVFLPKEICQRLFLMIEAGFKR